MLRCAAIIDVRVISKRVSPEQLVGGLKQRKFAVVERSEAKITWKVVVIKILFVRAVVKCQDELLRDFV